MLSKNRMLGTLARVALAFVCMSIGVDVACAGDVAIVTGKNSQFRAVKAADLAKMIKTTHKLPDGYELTIILTDPSPEMRIVAQKLLSLTADEFKQLIDTANQTKVAFRMVSGDDATLKALQSDPEAIGLVNVYSINSNVEVVKIDGKLPLEPGYILHSQ